MDYITDDETPAHRDEVTCLATKRQGLSSLFLRHFPHPWNSHSHSPAWWMTMASSPSTRGREGLDPACPGPSSASGMGPTLLSITTTHTYDPRPP
ncbi:protein Frey 1 isoform X3 [Macaca mulatta]